MSRVIWIVSLLALALGYGCGSQRSQASKATSTEEVPAAAAQAPAKTETSVSPATNASALPEKLSIRRIRADVVRVDTLTALTIDAKEIHCPDIKASWSFPIPTIEDNAEVQGDVVEAVDLTVHFLRANVIEANHIVVKQLRYKKDDFRWPGAGQEQAAVRNRRVANPAGGEPPAALKAE